MPKKSELKCYFGCAVDGTLHRFPKSENERYEVWKSVLKVEMQEKGYNYIYNAIRLCYRHFEDCYRLPSKLLTRNAIPTLYVDPLKSEVLEASDMVQENLNKGLLGLQPHTSNVPLIPSMPSPPEPTSSHTLKRKRHTVSKKSPCCKKCVQHKMLIKDLTKKLMKIWNKYENCCSPAKGKIFHRARRLVRCPRSDSSRLKIVNIAKLQCKLR